ncbi:hypothetical protein ACOME3_002736 [Neoechinorhynchus agilis]
MDMEKNDIRLSDQDIKISIKSQFLDSEPDEERRKRFHADASLFIKALLQTNILELELECATKRQVELIEAVENSKRHTLTRDIPNRKEFPKPDITTSHQEKDQYEDEVKTIKEISESNVDIITCDGKTASKKLEAQTAVVDIIRNAGRSFLKKYCSQ